jgi:hypothetical protein
VLDRCFCRYVTNPRFRVPHIRRLPHAAFHLRSGYADLREYQLIGVAQAAAAARGTAAVGEAELRNATWTWLTRACGTAGLRRLSQRGALVLSDAPALHAYFSAAGTTRAGAPPEPYQTTRSWAVPLATRLSVLLDVHAAGIAAAVEHSPSSTFLRPAVARSVCVRRVRALDAPDGACADWSRVWVRDLHKFVGGRYARHYESCAQPALPAAHPCKGRSLDACRDLLAAAGAGVVAPSARTLASLKQVVCVRHRKTNRTKKAVSQFCEAE